MTAISLVGGLTLALPARSLEKLLLPLVAFSAGALIGGAFYHMIPAAVATGGNALGIYAWVFAGFATFFMLDQFLHWHHCQRADSASTFLLGGLICFFLARQLEVGFLLPFAAGNFLYIGASDLVPEVNKHYGLGTNLTHFACFAGGAALLMGIKLAFE